MVRQEVVKLKPSPSVEAKLQRGSGQAKLKLKPRRKKMTWGFVTCGPNEALVIAGMCPPVILLEVLTRQMRPDICSDLN